MEENKKKDKIVGINAKCPDDDDFRMNRTEYEELRRNGVADLPPWDENIIN